MEKVTAVRKMSDDRLRLRLVQAGYLTEDVERLDRQCLKSILTTDNRSKGQKDAVAVANKTSSDKPVLKNGSKFTTENKSQGHGATPKPAISKHCFGCGSSDHLLNNCPEWRSTFTGNSKSNAQSKQVSHCAVEKLHCTGLATACVRDQLGLVSDVLSTGCDTGIFDPGIKDSC